MPNFDRTGPNGQGPKTGKKRGQGNNGQGNNGQGNNGQGSFQRNRQGRIK